MGAALGAIARALRYENSGVEVEYAADGELRLWYRRGELQVRGRAAPAGSGFAADPPRRCAPFCLPAGTGARTFHQGTIHCGQGGSQCRCPGCPVG
jgi:hypothetical protein